MLTLPWSTNYSTLFDANIAHKLRKSIIRIQHIIRKDFQLKLIHAIMPITSMLIH